MKRIGIYILVIMFSMVGLIGCGNNEGPVDESEEDPYDYEELVEEDVIEFTIVATTFPQYDWTRQILGTRLQNIELILLQDTAVDLHNFQPTVSDIATISTADMFIYIGGDSDGWACDALENAINQDMIVINLISELEEATPLLTYCPLDDDCDDHHHHHNDCDHDHHHRNDDCSDDHHHDDCSDDHHHHNDCSDDHHHHNDCDHDYHHHNDCDHDHHHHNDCDDDHHHHNDCDDDHHHHHHDCDDHHHGTKCDEHIWLSLRNAQLLSSTIAEALSYMDPEHADYYQDNLITYLGKLSALNLEYEQMIRDASKNTVLVGDRFPFRYLMNDYHIRYYAAFYGCSAETEASFSIIVYLAGKMDELGLESILVTEASDFSIAETIRDNTNNGGQEILVLDSMQSVSRADVDAGVTFLSIMESNLEVLRQALN